MDISKLSLFKVAETRMDWASQRQKVLSQNVANVDTPGYKARDLESLDFGDMARQFARRMPVAKTSGSHMEGTAGSGTWRSDRLDPPFETNPNGNDVVLEEQMHLVKETKGQFNKAASLYGKHVSMLKTAIGKGR